MTTETLEIKPKDAAELQRLLKTLTRILHRPAASLRNAAPRRAQPFDFHARVTIASTRKPLRAIHGKTGTILGRAPGHNGWVYTVFIDGHDECWSLTQSELKPSSKPAPKSPAGTVRHVRVRVDKHGRGRAAQ